MITFKKANMTITIKKAGYCTIQQGDKKLTVGYTIATGRGIRLQNPVQYIDDFRELVSVFEELYDNSDEIEENKKLQEEKKAINGFALDDDMLQQIQALQDTKEKKVDTKKTEVITLDNALEFFSQKGTVTVTRELDDYTSRAYVGGEEKAKKIIYSMNIEKQLDGGEVEYSTIKNILLAKKEEKKQLKDAKKREEISKKTNIELAQQNGGSILIDIQNLEEGQNYIYALEDGTIQTIHMS